MRRIYGMMLSIWTFPISPAKNSSSVMAALISLRAGNRRRSLDSLESKFSKMCYLVTQFGFVQVSVTEKNNKEQYWSKFAISSSWKA